MSCSHVVADEVARGNFEDTGPDRDWGDRNEALLALQRLFDEAAKIEQTDDEAMFDAEAWRALRLPLQQCLRDPRSHFCLLYTSPSPRDATLSRMPSSA